jgi:hypothetical protein
MSVCSEEQKSQLVICNGDALVESVERFVITIFHTINICS